MKMVEESKKKTKKRPKKKSSSSENVSGSDKKSDDQTGDQTDNQNDQAVSSSSNKQKEESLFAWDSSASDVDTQASSNEKVQRRLETISLNCYYRKV